MVSNSGKDNVGDSLGRNPYFNCCAQSSLRAIVIAYLNETAEPLLEYFRSCLTRWQRLYEEPRWPARALPCDVSQTLIHGAQAVFFLEVR